MWGVPPKSVPDFTPAANEKESPLHGLLSKIRCYHIMTFVKQRDDKQPFRRGFTLSFPTF